MRLQVFLKILEIYKFTLRMLVDRGVDPFRIV